MVTIKPLSRSRLRAALVILRQEFKHPPLGEHYALSLPLSLLPGQVKHLLGLSQLQYWVAVTEAQEVVGVTGIYVWRSDITTSWVGWTCVQPDLRGQGIGHELLTTVIKTARQIDRCYRLQVWTLPDSLRAQKFYRSMGFMKGQNPIFVKSL